MRVTVVTANGQTTATATDGGSFIATVTMPGASKRTQQAAKQQATEDGIAVLRRRIVATGTTASEGRQLANRL